MTLTNEAFANVMFSITVITLCFQFYIAYLIKYQSNKAMREYRFYLALLLFWEFLFTFEFWIIWQPVPIHPLLGALVTGIGRHMSFQLCLINVSVFKIKDYLDF